LDKEGLDDFPETILILGDIFVVADEVVVGSSGSCMYSR
jgi:hypothetical protein